MLPERVFYCAKGKPWQMAVVAAAIAGFLVVALLRTVEHGSASSASLFPLVVLLPLAAFAFRGHYIRRPKLRISAQGVWYAGWDETDPLAWHSVTGVKEVVAGPGHPFIVFESRDDRAFPRDRLPKHSLRVSDLDIRHEDAVRLITDYWHAAQVGTQGHDAARAHKREA